MTDRMAMRLRVFEALVRIPAWQTNPYASVELAKSIADELLRKPKKPAPRSATK